MPIYVDNTILSAVARCTTKSQLRHGLGLTTADEYATLRCGSAWHKAMEVYLRTDDVHQAYGAFIKDYEPWAMENVPSNHRLDALNVERILARWLDEHKVDDLPYIVPSPEFVEVGFAYPLDSSGDIIFTGRLDAAVIARDTDDWYVLDHKTTGYITHEKVQKYQLESQMTGYIWALQQQLSDRVRGAYINMIELKKLPSDPKRKCKTHGVPYSECGVYHAESQLFVVERTPEQIEQWRQTAIGLAYDYDWAREEYPTLEDMPRAKIEGAFNGSCEWCEFSQLCTMGKPVDIMRQNLVYQPWQPWEGIEDV